MAGNGKIEIPPELLDAFVKKLEAVDKRKRGASGNPAPQQKPQQKQQPPKRPLQNDMAQNDMMLAQAQRPAAKMMKIGFTPPTQQRSPSNNWLLIFGDLTALLITFFVLLFSMSTLNTGNWDRLVEVFNRSFASEEQPENALQANLGIDSFGFGHGQNIDYLRLTLETALDQNDLLKNAVLESDQSQLVIRFKDGFRFEDQTQRLIQPELTESKLAELSKIITQIDNQIEIKALGAAVGAVVGAGAAADMTSDKIAQQLELGLARSKMIAALLMAQGYGFSPRISVGFKDDQVPSQDQADIIIIIRQAIYNQ